MLGGKSLKSAADSAARGCRKGRMPRLVKVRGIGGRSRSLVWRSGADTLRATGERIIFTSNPRVATCGLRDPMTRIFTTLAVLLTLALLASFGIGLYTISLETSLHQKDVYLVHLTLGLFTALGALLVHCMIFTYFLGTGRWVKEVGLAYSLPDANYPKRTRELKRTAFPPALFAMLILIATAAAGAGRQLEVWHWGIHLTLAVLAILINLWAFRVEYRCLRNKAADIEGGLSRVVRIRAVRGLCS